MFIRECEVEERIQSAINVFMQSNLKTTITETMKETVHGDHQSALIHVPLFFIFRQLSKCLGNKYDMPFVSGHFVTAIGVVLFCPLPTNSLTFAVIFPLTEIGIRSKIIRFR